MGETPQSFRLDNIENFPRMIREAPASVINLDWLADAAKTQNGAMALSVPDPWKPWQASLSLYMGVTTPDAGHEVLHWHPDQDEVYLVLKGKARMLVKHRWGDAWEQLEVNAGEMIIVSPESCHWFYWQTYEGFALVIKAPQRGGVGKFPAGKVVCAFCPHYGTTCTLPSGAPARLEAA